MKRFAYLISNNEGLQGVKKDVADFRAFLMSCEGGAWNSNEICSQRVNSSLQEVLRDLALIKVANYDYVVFYFSGHGSCIRDTRLYLNSSDENISESSVFGLSQKQLSIFDCCRSNPNDDSVKQASVCDESINSANIIRDLCREKFDRLVKNVSPQQIALYACRIGEYAIATANGSFYTQSLLSMARSMCIANDADAVSMHVACSSIVTRISKIHGMNQHPDTAVVRANHETGMLPFAIKKPQVLLG